MGRMAKAVDRMPSQRDSQELRDAMAEAAALREELKAWKEYVKRATAHMNHFHRQWKALKQCVSTCGDDPPKTENTAHTGNGEPDEVVTSPVPAPALLTTAERRAEDRSRREEEPTRSVRVRLGESVFQRTQDDLPHGCRVLRGVVDPALMERSVPELQWAADNDCRVISAGQKGKKRRQLKIGAQTHISKAMLKALTEAGEMDGRTRSEINVLDSLPGCTEQKLHWDYDPGLIDCLDPRFSRKPASAILALQRGTRLYVYDERARRTVPVPLSPGDILIFEGDVAHHGAWYATRNTRMHVYLDVDMVPREEDVTWFDRW